MRSILSIAEIFVIVLLAILAAAPQGRSQSNDSGSKPIVCTYAGATSGSSISKSKFLSDSTIQSFGENSIYTYRYKIVSFNISVIPKGGEALQEFKSEGNRVPAKAKELIKTVPGDSKVFFERIRAKLEIVTVKDTSLSKPNYDVLRQIEPMSFTIVED